MIFGFLLFSFKILLLVSYEYIKFTDHIFRYDVEFHRLILSIIVNFTTDP